MDFNIDLSEFPSEAHKKTYIKARRKRAIVPFSRTLDDIDPELRNSCLAMHGFIMEMYSDMYQNMSCYQGDCSSFLKSIGRKGTLKDDGFVVPAEKLQGNSKKDMAALAKNLEALSCLKRVGFTFELLPTNEYLFTCKAYPEMFPALKLLDNSTHSFSLLHIHNIENGYKPSCEDFFHLYSEKERALAYEIHNFAAEHKVRITFNKNGGIVYHYKSKMLLKYSTSRGLGIGITIKDKSDPYTIVEGKLSNEPQNFQHNAMKHMHGCATCENSKGNGCSSESSGKYINVLGKRHEMCNTEIISFAWHSPTVEDVTIIKRLIEIRREIIEEAQAAKKAK